MDKIEVISLKKKKRSLSYLHYKLSGCFNCVDFMIYHALAAGAVELTPFNLPANNRSLSSSLSSSSSCCCCLQTKLCLLAIIPPTVVIIYSRNAEKFSAESTFKNLTKLNV